MKEALMRRFVLTLVVLSAAAATAVLAQPTPAARPVPRAPVDAPAPEGPGGPGAPPFARDLFPPELVLQNQIAIGLSDSQVTSIKRLLNETHARTLDAQMDLSRASERLSDALRPARVDEAAAIGLADQVMGCEMGVKRAQLAMLIRLKNLLTPEQQDKLRELRPAKGPPQP